MYNPCYTCRRRRIQCDQSKPSCMKCQKAGLKCFDKRPLRWVNGVAVRGKLQGLSAKDASAGIAKTDLIPIQTGGSPMDSFIEGIGHKAWEHLLNTSPNLPLALEAHPISSLDRTSRYYLDYYNDQICKLFIVYDSNKNPFRSLISLALSDSVLLKAILALAARHRVNSGCSFNQPAVDTSSELIDAHRDALLFKYQAIQGLTHALSDLTTSKQATTTVASTFLLIFMDLLESGSDKWNFHIEGVKKLITFNLPLSDSKAGTKQDPGQTVLQIRNFIATQIYSIETLGATFVRPGLLFNFASLNQSVEMHQETVEQSFLGCPEYLLHAIQYLLLQRDAIAVLQPHDYSAIQTHMDEITTVLESIHNFDCDMWALNQPHQKRSPPYNISNLRDLSLSYKLGALIYGQCILDALVKETTSHDDLVDELISVIDTLKDDRTLFKCTLWPIFIAGLECRWQFQRDFLVACLERFWVDTSCINVVNSAKTLKEYWQRRDQQGLPSTKWVFDIGSLDNDWLFI